MQTGKSERGVAEREAHDARPASKDVVQRLENWGIDDADSEELYALLADAARELRDTRAGLAACNRVLQQTRIELAQTASEALRTIGKAVTPVETFCDDSKEGK